MTIFQVPKYFRFGRDLSRPPDTPRELETRLANLEERLEDYLDSLQDRKDEINFFYSDDTFGSVSSATAQVVHTHTFTPPDRWNTYAIRAWGVTTFDVDPGSQSNHKTYLASGGSELGNSAAGWVQLDNPHAAFYKDTAVCMGAPSGLSGSTTLQLYEIRLVGAGGASNTTVENVAIMGIAKRSS